MNTVSDKDNIIGDSTVVPANQNKDISTYMSALKDRDLFYIYKKIRRLSAVVFRLAGMITDNSLMTDKLRQSALSLISNFSSLSGNVMNRNLINKVHIENNILEILSQLEVASFSNLVSPMNISVLEREYDDLLRRITELGDSERGEALNLEVYLKEPKEKFRFNGNEVISNKLSDRAGVESVKDNKYDLYDDHSELVKDEESDKGKLRDFSSVAVKKNRRQSLVINLLKRKKEIMIKDLSGIINDCSEKTIQRELLALVSSGILKKTGERRWTRYSLAK